MEDDPARLEFRDPLIGRVLQERYRVIRVLGRGGMGIVYLAEHVLIQRKLAIKLLHSQLTASEELIQRFHREARAAAAVGNEHIVDVTDMGRLEDGTYFIVMEYLEGLDLSVVVAEQGPMPVARAVDIAAQICAGLSAVHAAGIVHRDLKPENIVLIQRERRPDFVKILDFGICKVLHERPLTASGVALGTPQFMAPEQLEARPEVDQRADVYAVGAILFFALCGRIPFNSESLPRLLVEIWSQPPAMLRSLRPDAPESLERVVARALEKHPDQRFPDCGALAAQLTEVASELGMLRPTSRAWALASGVRETVAAVRVESQVARVLPRRSKRNRLAAACSMAVLGAVLFVGWMYTVLGSLPAVPQPAAAPKAAAPARSAAQASPPAPSVQPASVEVDRSEPRRVRGAGPASPLPLRVKPRVRPPESTHKPTAATSTPAEAQELHEVPTLAPSPPPEARSNAPEQPPLADDLIVPRPAELKRVF